MGLAGDAAKTSDLGWLRKSVGLIGRARISGQCFCR